MCSSLRKEDEKSVCFHCADPACVVLPFWAVSILHNWKKKEIPSFSNNQKCCPLIAENRREKEKPSDLSTIHMDWILINNRNCWYVYCFWNFMWQWGHEKVFPIVVGYVKLESCNSSQARWLVSWQTTRQTTLERKKKQQQQKNSFFFQFRASSFSAPVVVVVVVLEREKETPPKVFHTAWPVFHFLIFKKKERKKEIN